MSSRFASRAQAATRRSPSAITMPTRSCLANPCANTCAWLSATGTPLSGQGPMCLVPARSSAPGSMWAIRWNWRSARPRRRSNFSPSWASTTTASTTPMSRRKANRSRSTATTSHRWSITLSATRNRPESSCSGAPPTASATRVSPPAPPATRTRRSSPVPPPRCSAP